MNNVKIKFNKRKFEWELNKIRRKYAIKNKIRRKVIKKCVLFFAKTHLCILLYNVY